MQTYEVLLCGVCHQRVAQCRCTNDGTPSNATGSARHLLAKRDTQLVELVSPAGVAEVLELVLAAVEKDGCDSVMRRLLTGPIGRRGIDRLHDGDLSVLDQFKVPEAEQERRRRAAGHSRVHG